MEQEQHVHVVLAYAFFMDDVYWLNERYVKKGSTDQRGGRAEMDQVGSLSIEPW